MTKAYSTKELAEKLKPGILGLKGAEDLLIFRLPDPFDPKLKGFLSETAWREVTKVEGVIQAYPTLENYLDFLFAGFSFVPTQKVSDWLGKNNFGLIENWLPEKEVEKENPLFDYQREGARFLTAHKRAMLSLSPGLGKTLTSAYAAGLEGFDNVLVVCPASLLYYWKGELEKWAGQLPRKPYAQIWHRKIEPLDEELMFPTQFWAITNPETVAKHKKEFIEEPKAWFDCLILDESIMYKHRDSQRSKAIKDLASVVDTCWLLTGAPATRYLDDMFHQFHILKPKGYASYWRFARKYCIVDDTDWGSKVVANKPDAEKEIKKNFSDIYFARSQDDVANIPDWIMEDIDIPMLPKQDEAYETLRKELYIKLDSVDPNEIITVNNHLSLMIRSIQVASNPLLVGGVNSAGKWDALPELMEIYPGPYIVWVQFIKTGEMLREKLSKLGMKTALANGSTPMKDRNDMVNTIQNGGLDALVLNNDVGKYGWNITKARTAFFVERTYSDAYFQCLHRNRRIGTENSPIIVNMRSVTQQGKRTIDALIHSTQDYRTGMIRKVTSGDLKKVFER